MLSNKFDLALKAANANTIDATQASKGTVSVAGTDKTSTLIHSQQDGTDTLKSVKMGSEVKITAKEGYKFRKVEVKKASALKTLTVKGMQLKYVEGDTWQQAIERPENAGSGWRVQDEYILNDELTLMIGSGYVRPGHTIDATKNYSLEAD